MPGIVGLITNLPRHWAEPQLLSMVEAVRHEPFYETGTQIDESLGIYMGWAIRKGSFSEGLPITNEKESVTLFFSGSVYSDAHTIRTLRDKGHSIDGRAASYLVHCYEEDHDFFADLNGLFHGLIVDSTRQIATLFNDRYGMHRLCYHQSDDAFYFAAEAKAILAVLPELRRADEKSIGEFVACSCVLQNRTIFKNIYALPGGSAWTFRNAALEKRVTYFQPTEWEQQSPLGEEDYYRELREVFANNLPLYFSGRERVGVSLTGGLDTRVIMAWQKAEPGSLPCYTFGGMLRDCEDVRIARRIAHMYGQPYEVIPIANEFLSRFPHYAERSIYMTEGGVDVYRASDLYVSEKARQIAPAKVVGTYGSEIIRHAVMFKPTPPFEGLFRSDFTNYIHQGAETYNELRNQHPVTFAVFAQSPWYHQGILALESSQLSVRSPYLDSEFVRTVFRGPQTSRSNADIRLRLIQDGNPKLAKIPSDRGVGGVSGNSFLLSRGLLEFTFKAEYAYDYGMPQWASRIDSWLAPLHVERLFLGRHKVSHFRVWYRDILSKYVREMLLDRRTLSRPYLEPKAVEAVVDGHTKRGMNHTTTIHKLLTLELLERQFFDGQ
jgi:asparagine synthase (glutamine-hydrolysing)